MSSHSRTKGKARKSTASSAKSGAKVPETSPSLKSAATSGLAPRSTRPAAADDSFTLTQEQIAGIARAATKTFTDQQGMDTHPATDHAARVDEALRGIHPSMSVHATEREQAEQHLFSSIITALRPFYRGS